MKHQFLLLFLLLLHSLISFASDQPATQHEKVVLHLNDGYKLSVLENSVKYIRNDMGKHVDIKVVINGNAVTRLLRTNENSTQIVETVLKDNVDIELCHNALNNNNVKPEMLIEGLKVLQTDGNVTVIRYQQQGYLYIKL